MAIGNSVYTRFDWILDWDQLLWRYHLQVWTVEVYGFCYDVGGSIMYFGKFVILVGNCNFFTIIILQIPNATTVTKLLPPHFTLGLGIGIIDAALVPLLATFMDTNDKSNENDAFASRFRCNSM
jgi:uncharacterized integral membrane protein